MATQWLECFTFIDILVHIFSPKESKSIQDVVFGLLNSQANLKSSYAIRKMVIVPFPGNNDWGAGKKSFYKNIQFQILYQQTRCWLIHFKQCPIGLD